MKHLVLHLFLYLAISMPAIVSAQPLTFRPGPANLDTTRFAHVYFIRDTDDGFPDNWLGVIMKDDRGMCVKAQMNRIYRVNTVLTGPTRFSSSINGVKNEFTLDLHPGDNHYVEIKPVRQTDGTVRASLRVLKDVAGIERVNAFPSAIQERYCLMPNDQEHFDYLENVWKDTMTWYASKEYRYFFKPLPSWELIMRSPLLTTLSFRNNLISDTYSESGGIMPLTLKKCASQEEFDAFCKQDFIQSLLSRKQDSLIGYDVKPIAVAEGVGFARLVGVDYKTESDNLSYEGPLYMRSVQIVFYWTDSRGKGHSAALFDSERGLPEELHTMPQLEERMRWSWNSFRLAEEKSYAGSGQ